MQISQQILNESGWLSATSSEVKRSACQIKFDISHVRISAICSYTEGKTMPIEW
jgi:hypothetical protein